MKKGFILVTLSCLLVTSLILASCSAPSSTTSSSTTNPVTTSQTTTVATTPTTSVVQTTTTSTATTVIVNHNIYWETGGIHLVPPQYGGTLTDYSPLDFGLWDPYNSSSLATCNSAFMEGLYGDDWALNPSVFDFSTGFRPRQTTSMGFLRRHGNLRTLELTLSTCAKTSTGKIYHR